MNLERELFHKYKIQEERLISYGFIKEKGVFTFKKNILANKFMIIIEYDKEITGKIIELKFNEEYDNFRRQELGEYNSEIKQEFIDLLIDIRNHCCIKESFKYSQTKRINEFIMREYGIEPEFLWEKFPSYAIYRKKKKWFALIGSAPFNKIDKTSNLIDEVEIINIKVSEADRQLLNSKGYYEAYHMNKKTWLTIILNETLADEQIRSLIIKSYELIP